MNTRSNALHETSVGSQVAAPAVIPETQRFYWLVRRELWEHWTIYVAPLAAAAIALFAFLISTIHLPAKMREMAALDPGTQHALIEEPYSLAALLIMGATFIVALFYSVNCLQSERRDRSILFWKSLPVSDLTTVLSKACIPLVILPLLTFAITLVTHWIMLLLNVAVLAGSGLSAAVFLSRLAPVHMWLMLFYHLIAIHGLWYAPIYGWLILVSAWARRAALLWAVLPPLAIGVFEKIAFNTSRAGALLGYRIGGDPGGMASSTGGTTMDSLTHIAPVQLLMSPGFWIGLAATAAFLAGAARLRRYREPN